MLRRASSVKPMSLVAERHPSRRRSLLAVGRCQLTGACRLCAARLWKPRSLIEQERFGCVRRRGDEIIAAGKFARLEEAINRVANRVRDGRIVEMLAVVT